MEIIKESVIVVCVTWLGVTIIKGMFGWYD